jgi:metal-responsive CopG/Arc/MetJ family transcriptional regulator
MQIIEFKIDEPLLSSIDQAAKMLAMSRSDFIEAALQRALRQQRKIALERQHAEGYARQPQTESEREDWESVRGWPE